MQRFVIGFLAALLIGAGAFAYLEFAKPDQGQTSAPAASADIQPPVARIEPKVFSEHGGTRTDNYYWVRDKESPEVIAHLEAENAYAEARLKPIKPLIDELYEEMKARLDDADVSVPYFDNGYWYESRYAEGADYPVIVRRKGAQDAPEETVLDVPALAKGHEDQFNLNAWVVSPDNLLVAYAVDFSGNRIHKIFVRNIASGETVDESVEGASSDLVFSADSKTLFYVHIDPETVRAYQVFRHAIGGDAKQDTLVYEEKDNIYEIAIGRSKSRKYLFITSDHLHSSEIRTLELADPAAEPRLMEARRPGVRYYADHVGDRFYVLTDLEAPDFRIVTAPEDAPQAANWTTIVPETKGRFIGNFTVFDKYLVLDEEHDAITSMRIFRRAGMSEIAVPRPAEIGIESVGDYDDAVNLDPSLATVRFGFQSPLQPETIYDFNMETGELKMLKQDPAVKWFKPEPYAMERIWATAGDGVKVPVTLVYRKDMKQPGGNPTLVYGYGSYGYSEGPYFRPTWMSMVDRGFVLAVAHIRGGREMGQGWYENGRMKHKINTFTDFIAATEALVAQGYADPRRVFARGGSAGGLLMGAVVNMRPDLYNGVVAEVPFVDVITTMSDPAIPLTTFEYEEWGNPAIADEYAYMLRYSPYDNVKAQAYPALFVTAGLNDSQVGYFEPAKWVARLRATKTDANELIFKVNMGAGHHGDSGRLGWLEERAEVMAWMITRARAAEARH